MMKVAKNYIKNSINVGDFNKEGKWAQNLDTSKSSSSSKHMEETDRL